MPQTRIGIFGNKRMRSTPLDPKLLFWCVFVVFGCICQMFRYYVKLGAKRVQLVQLMHKFVPQSCIRIFRKERTGSTPLEPNSCSGAFRSVSVHLAMFRYCTKLGAKRVKLVQLMKKFVPRNRIRVFRNERTRSSPLDAKLMNWCVL